MPDDSAAKTQEPESLDESTEEEKPKSASSSDSIEEEDYDDVDPEDEDKSAAKPQEPKSRDESKKEEKNSSSDEEDSSDSSDSSDFSDSDYSDEEDENEAGEGKVNEKDLRKNSAEDNIRLLTAAIEKNKFRERKLEDQMVYERDVYDLPKDPEGWREEDLRELWADAPVEMTKPGWDPAWADDEDWAIVDKEVEDGNDPPIAPFYLPYRRYYPVIPDDNIEIANPKSVIEELDRIEEFLKWGSYIFPDGSSYEGTLWDDLAHGKGVYITENGLVRYEGEWLQNHMSGHGVVEVDIPDIEPAPGSQLEAKMRAEGKIISRDFMSPKDRSWLEMDIEDSFQLADGKYEIPFYENEEWVRQFGSKPEKGRYKYAGQWKHGRMHGCGVYEVNERIIFGRFYFGELLEESAGCDADISTLHAGIAEVAAAKARMFMNKPDGMVREDRGPYNDPQHPYMYEEDDAWMAPGFINQFYEVPDFWKMYVHEVDQEREMWLNSFYKSPLRIPMPAELEYWWSTERSPEFILVNKEPEPDPEDPSKLIYTEDPLILHTRTGRLIDYVEDEEHGIRLFWQPKLKDGEDVDPEKVEFLPVGYDDFFGRTVKKRSKQAWFMTRVLGFMERVDNACQKVFEGLEKWTEAKQKESEIKRKAIEEELELIEEEIVLEEKIEELDRLLKMQQKEEEKRAMMDEKREDDLSSASVHQQNLDVDEQEEEEEEDEESPTSFGSVLEEDQAREPNSTKDDKKGTTNGKSSFASISMPRASSSLTSVVPSMLPESFLSWRKERSAASKIPSDSGLQRLVDPSEQLKSVHFSHSRGPCTTLRTAREHQRFHRKNHSFLQLRSLARILLDPKISKGLKATQSAPPEWAPHHNHHEIFEKNPQNILSMHVPLYPSGYYNTNFI